MDNSFIVDGFNVAELNDDELSERLQNLGFNPGPILPSTREVYQRKLVRLLKNEDFDDSVDNESPAEEEDILESPKLSSSYESSYSANLSYNLGDLRRRPLSRVEGESWSNDPPTLSPHKPWSPDDIVTQVQPPPEEEKQSLLSSTFILVGVIAVMVFLFFVYYNMESTPQTPIP